MGKLVVAKGLRIWSVVEDVGEEYEKVWDHATSISGVWDSPQRSVCCHQKPGDSHFFSRVAEEEERGDYFRSRAANRPWSQIDKWYPPL